MEEIEHGARYIKKKVRKNLRQLQKMMLRQRSEGDVSKSNTWMYVRMIEKIKAHRQLFVRIFNDEGQLVL